MLYWGRKIAIVADRQQTTRNRILGIKNYHEARVFFVDTPGIHKPAHKLGSIMVKTAREVLSEMDLVVLLLTHATERDRDILESFKNLGKPVMLLINKNRQDQKAGDIISY